MKKNITIYTRDPEEMKLTEEEKEISKQAVKAMVYLEENVTYSRSIAIIIRELIEWQDQLINHINREK